MVTALVNGKRIEIRHLYDLASVVESSQRSQETLVLLDESEHRFEIAPGDPRERLRSWKPTAEQLERAYAAAGGWKGLVDAEELKRAINESKGQRRRDWEPCDS